MNILIINGSPHKDGAIATILVKMWEAMDKNHSIEWVNVYDLQVKPCMGCLQCRLDKPCVLEEDDGQRVGRMINQADLIIVGSPTYWSNISGPLKTLLDRLVTTFEDFSGGGFPKPRLKGKKVIIVNSSGAPWPFNQKRQTIRAIETPFKNGGCNIIGTVCYDGTGLKKAIPEKVLVRAGKMGAKF